jgi:serine/threonine-protein kinase
VVRGRYRVVALLSDQGGMSTVYEAMDSALNIRCALKEMVPYPGTPGTALPQLRDQFQQEAQLLAGLRHPNMTRVSDHFEDDGNAYLVMDFINGKGLDELIAEKGRLTEEEVLGWARQLIQALAHCHEHGVIHRDVKPQNVMITWQGQAMLVDFGLAKLVDPDDPRTRTVMRGLGTPEYAPPEQYDIKQGRTDPRTDIYSLGATLYHALVGEPPPTVSERVMDPQMLVSVREFRDDVSEVIDRVLMKALALPPAQRFQDVGRMYHALFGSPLPKEGAERVVPLRDEPQSAGSSDSTVLLSLARTAGARVGRRPRLGVAALGLVGLVAVVSLVVGRVSMGSAPMATTTPTVLVAAVATATSTSTPTAMPTTTVTPTPAIPAVVSAVAGLELAQSDDPDPVASGASLTYTLAYTNAGDATATGVLVADTLDPNVTYVGASITPTHRTTSTLYWDVGALSPAAAGEVVLSVTVPCGLGEGTVLTNAATIDSDETVPLSVTQTTVISQVDPACFVPSPATATPMPTPTPTDTPSPGGRRDDAPPPTNPSPPPPTNTPRPPTPVPPTDTPRPTPAPTQVPESGPTATPEG